MHPLQWLRWPRWRAPLANRRVAFGACQLDLDERRLLAVDGAETSEALARSRPR